MFRPISVPDQNANNALKRYADDGSCCDGYPSACQYDVTVATANTVSAIVIKRTAESPAETLSFSAAAGGAAAVAAIKAALEAAGYENDADQITGVSSAAVSTNTVYSITGGLIVVSLTHSGGSASATAKCTRLGVCDFYIEIPGGAANEFGVNDTVEDLGSLTLVGNTAAEVVTAIEGAAEWPSGYTVAVVETATEFQITINGPGPIVFTWNGEQFTKQDCVAAYIA